MGSDSRTTKSRSLTIRCNWWHFLILAFAILPSSLTPAYSSKESEADFKQGLALVDQKHIYKALPFFEHAIKLDPNFKNAYLARGHVLLELDEDEKGLLDLDRVLKMDPTNVMALSDRLRAYFELRRFQDAMNDASKLILLAKTPSEKSLAYRWRGKMHVQLKQPTEGIADYSAAMLADPKDHNNYAERAPVYEALGQYEKAIADYSTSIRLSNPHDHNLLKSYSSRGRCYEKIGKKDLAEADRKFVESRVKAFEEN